MGAALESPAIMADSTAVEVATPMAAITPILVMIVAMRMAGRLAPMVIRAQEIPVAMVEAGAMAVVVEAAAAEADSYRT
jgi:hypothetical protein